MVTRGRKLGTEQGGWGRGRCGQKEGEAPDKAGRAR